LTSSTFTLSKISIIESLPQNEVQTGVLLNDYINGLSLQDVPPTQLLRITSGQQLLQQLLSLERDAEAGEIPLIHFETHGTIDGKGLVTANLDIVSWTEISKILCRINLATRFNLIVFVAACNGGFFLDEMKAIEPSPCYALMAPTDEVDPGEVMRAARDFYRLLLTTAHATRAIASLENQPLQQGRWFAKWAESWYREVVIEYIRTHCTPKALKQRAREMNKHIKAQGSYVEMKTLKRQLINSTRTDLTGKYFERFFVLKAFLKMFLGSNI
jgi:hypothetical protein